MRLNKFLATHTELSRRKADEASSAGRVLVNGKLPEIGQSISQEDSVSLDGIEITPQQEQSTVVLLNKPIGFVCSKNGQGSRSVYSLLPETYQQFNIAGRLDKDSSGLLVLTNDGDLVHELTHPSTGKSKQYEISLYVPLKQSDIALIQSGVDIGDDRPSKMKLTKLSDTQYQVTLQEGRNRQIRRTFEAVGYTIKSLHRTSMGKYHLGNLQPKKHTVLQ